MQHRKTLMLVLTALFAALTAVGAFFKIPFALAAISLQFLFTAMAGILLGAGYGALSQLVYEMCIRDRCGALRRTRAASTSTGSPARSRHCDRFRPGMSNYEENMKIAVSDLSFFLYIPAPVCYSKSGRNWLC